MYSALKQSTHPFTVAALILLSASCWLCQAAVFSADSSRSQITLAGNIVAYTFQLGPINTQGPGSLTTFYGGTVNATVSLTALQFTGSSSILAETNGVWQPAAEGNPGMLAADYGGLAQNKTFYGPVTLYAALRNIVLDLTSPDLALSNGSFDPSTLVLSFLTNVDRTIDYRDSFSDQGTFPLAGSATNAASGDASLTTTGGVQKLVIPIDTTYLVGSAGSGALAGTTLHLTGQIVALRSVAAPIITSFAVTNHTAVLMVTNATLQSQLLHSADLKTWSAASATVTNGAGLIIFTRPVGQLEFFRVQN
jgi:hypothetical protein